MLKFDNTILQHQLKSETIIQGNHNQMARKIGLTVFHYFWLGWVCQFLQFKYLTSSANSRFVSTSQPMVQFIHKYFRPPPHTVKIFIYVLNVDTINILAELISVWKWELIGRCHLRSVVDNKNVCFFFSLVNKIRFAIAELLINNPICSSSFTRYFF